MVYLYTVCSFPFLHVPMLVYEGESTSGNAQLYLRELCWLFRCMPMFGSWTLLFVYFFFFFLFSFLPSIILTFRIGKSVPHPPLLSLPPPGSGVWSPPPKVSYILESVNCLLPMHGKFGSWVGLSTAPTEKLGSALLKARMNFKIGKAQTNQTKAIWLDLYLSLVGSSQSDRYYHPIQHICQIGLARSFVC